MKHIAARFIGRIDYASALALQESLLEARIRGEGEDTVLFVEHPAVVTLGRNAVEGNILLADEQLEAAGISLFRTGRGGDVTYHGPGQLVAYPILDLRPDRCDVRKYIRDLAEVMVRLARGVGIAAAPILDDPKKIGVFVDLDHVSDSKKERFAPDENARLAKIGALGVRLSRWVTMHGFAFNVATDLSGFGLIIPCGIREYGVTSVKELGLDAATRPLSMWAEEATRHFGDVFGVTTSFIDESAPKSASTQLERKNSSANTVAR